MKRTTLVAAAAVLAVLSASAGAEVKFKYVGVGNCKKCHQTAKQGEQYKKWVTTKHATAFATLSNEQSKEIANKKGIADPTKAPECLKCHLTGGGLPAENFDTTFKADVEGVGCEACHGPGSAYWKNSVMKAISAKTQDGKAVGLIDPSEKVCVKCHNSESPTMKGKFDFKTQVEKVSHPKPKA